ncbi:polyphosphate--glucose phosphotransferase [Aurantimicrobium minutum]|uniref:polyphosphate--glucose phosphotransferase n=1 Tax=Aurantimicrobium minutum TaxID=708131 RepID=UPI00247501CD|nr:ROK family protein [Aurantimicrobium minutum]MDH6239304.1 polyphosphate glucokinase [Aurantimicrobium minutum]
MNARAIGIDIGGTGIKGGLVDVDSGEIIGERIRVATPAGGEPEDIARVVKDVIEQLNVGEDVPVGICFPSSIRHGVTTLAANISQRWIGFEAEEFFEEQLGRNIHFVNDADAAGYAEVVYGAAKDQEGLVIMTTLGTGIGGAMIYNGVLIPNAELGHLEIDGEDAEKRAAGVIREREGLTYEEWAQRLQRYYSHVEMLFSPELFIVGGGISKSHEQFLPLLNLRTPIVPAKLLNKAGIMGAAKLAYDLAE